MPPDLVNAWMPRPSARPDHEDGGGTGRVRGGSSPGSAVDPLELDVPDQGSDVVAAERLGAVERRPVDGQHLQVPAGHLVDGGPVRGLRCSST
ncbi:MAG: hypothetical protein AVDCRST_MAG66-3782 [uncultured Pseudonocardia sp.]|uniref:Uncharacterized protein n=1 Tax=uncultured Pseudonocardia sp. TaxID=211455 RepID=A0A6J4Q246_9PSEU|nr:MAG: hypothetical protein AVDCRST_MAG66-3782 [uncultured Pseudonocardia sp.]